MSKLLEALRGKFKTPQEAVKALGLDATLVDEAVINGDSKEGMSMTTLTRRGAVAKGALMVYLKPRLAQDAQIDITPALNGLTRKNYADRRPKLLSTVRRLVRGKLAQDADIEDLDELLEALENMDGEEGEDNLEANAGVIGNPLRYEDEGEDDGGMGEVKDDVLDFLEDKVDPEHLDHISHLFGDDEEMDDTGMDWRRKEEADDRRRADDRKREAADMRRKRADDARRRLGRDESEEERDMREEAETAQDRERWEAEDRKHADDRKKRADDRKRAADRRMRAEDRKKRAEDARRSMRAEDAKRRLGRDETPEEKMARERDEEAQDRKRADDSRRKAEDGKRRAADRKKRAEDRRMRAKDEPADFPGKPKLVTQDELDRRLKIAADEARATERDIRVAEQYVRPWVGDMRGIAFDSASDVYKEALEHLGVETKGMHPSAYKAILDNKPRAGVAPVDPKRREIAMDAAGEKGFASRFPSTAAITQM